MRLKLVTGRAFRIHCVKCGRSANAGKEEVFADLDGRQFMDYYCTQCARAIRLDKEVIE